MRKRPILLFIGLCLLLCQEIHSGDDCFEKIKKSLSEAGCSQFEFLSILESDVFETTDTTSGSAYLAADGRYSVMVGRESYFNTGNRLYSYSREHNQVTVERADPKLVQENISFVTRLDDYYETEVISLNEEYRLKKIDHHVRSIPDLMQVFIDCDDLQLRELRFKDHNEDLNHIVILRQETDSECDEQMLVPDYPDSVEVVELF